MDCCFDAVPRLALRAAGVNSEAHESEGLEGNVNLEVFPIVSHDH